MGIKDRIRRKKTAHSAKEPGQGRRIRISRSSIADQLYLFVTEYDYRIIVSVVALVLFGVAMVFSAGYYSTMSASSSDPYYYLKHQGLFAFVGLILLYVFAHIDYHVYAKYAVPLALVSLGLLVLLLTPIGVEVNFATRWIEVLGFRITPSEISKLAMILFTASFLAKDPRRARDLRRGILPLVLLMAAHLVLIILQPNLSTAIVIAAIMIAIMLVAGLPIGYLVVPAAALTAGAVGILLFLPDSHWYSRLTNWIDPFADAQGEGYQVAQSVIALGNGGLTGLGAGKSVAKTLYLPEPQTDFILAIIGEELGFIGVFILMAVYLFLIWRCCLTAARAEDKLGMFMASGVAAMLALQVIINVAVVTASMPATGITLPFISYGGTSLCVFLAAMGILLNISRKQGKEHRT